MTTYTAYLYDSPPSTGVLLHTVSSIPMPLPAASHDFIKYGSDYFSSYVNLPAPDEFDWQYMLCAEGNGNALPTDPEERDVILNASRVFDGTPE